MSFIIKSTKMLSSLQLMEPYWCFEVKLHKAGNFKYRELFAECIKENWNRFLSDCYTILSCSQIIPEDLLLTLNSSNPSR